jgi:hypothetical protein
VNDAFASVPPDNEVLFELPVTKRWLRQVMVSLPLICRSSYLGVTEFMRDLLGVSTSTSTIHHVLQSAAQQAGTINRSQAARDQWYGCPFSSECALCSHRSNHNRKRSMQQRRIGQFTPDEFSIVQHSLPRARACVLIYGGKA